MHPVIRIVTFLVLGVFIATGGMLDLAVAAGLVGLLYIGNETASLSSAWPLLRRMRWLLLSIFILYLWFIPGRPVLPFYGMPSVEGIEVGVVRAGALILLVLAVNLLLQMTPREQLLSAILWLAAPLRWIGVDQRKLAVRIVLTLETVGQVQEMLGGQTLQQNTSRHPVKRIGAVAAALFHESIMRAEQAPCAKITIPNHGHPPYYQWLYPLSLAAAFWAVR